VIIGVASGKGGTGKTTIAVNLAAVDGEASVMLHKLYGNYFA
jgi:MinD-like ATPase involved in chromosome partitioning or flagellar assembly